MKNQYNHKRVEEKWQKKWDEMNLYKVSEEKDKPKYYILDMFPYPSGEGLHVGHPKGYIATDIFARMKMMQGFNVLHPMGFDAFGLPAENYAIKNKMHPRTATEKNVATYKRQLGKLGFTYDWEREVNTTDPNFYKWTQWIFLKMFERGLAYESSEPINWCPSCKTGLANEDLENGRCERCESEIERIPMRQWVLRITDYAERLLNDIKKLEDWDESIKEQQRNWIGRSEGAKVRFSVILNEAKRSEESRDPSTALRSAQDDNVILEVFTTRPDTLFGSTYMVVAPEHKLIEKHRESIKNIKEVEKYIKKAMKKSELERGELQKEKTGVRLEGISAINPVNGKEIPVFVADYVLVGYGTGAIMAVPAHDERDYEFAKKYNLEILEVVSGGDISEKAFSGEGVNVNSDFLNTLETKEAKKRMIDWLGEKGFGERAINYKLEDWVFSRQRYWGEPIPLVHCEKCGIVPIPESELPLLLPEVESYEPTGTGESPLSAITDWVNTTCPKCGGAGKRETNTMPQWAGSSWYYLRYIDPKNDKEMVSKEKESYWSPVDFYVGGAEHATRHLIYARFWHKFLYDIGVVSYEEPFKRLQHVGLIGGEDGRKMSKRWGNVVNPDDIVEEYGADSLRVYEMFMGPFSQACAWSTNGLVGARKFLEKVDDFFNMYLNKEKEELEKMLGDKEIKKATLYDKKLTLLHKTIKKVGEDIEGFKFNTAVAQMMVLINELRKENNNDGSVGFMFFHKEDMKNIVKILAPFAPHLAEEIWESLGEKESVFKDKWPQYDASLIVDKKINLVIQINGKVRETIEVEAEIKEEEAKKTAMENEKIKKWTEGKEILKVIFVKGKLVNIVLK